LFTNSIKRVMFAFLILSWEGTHRGFLVPLTVDKVTGTGLIGVLLAVFLDSLTEGFVKGFFAGFFNGFFATFFKGFLGGFFNVFFEVFFAIVSPLLLSEFCLSFHLHITPKILRQEHFENEWGRLRSRLRLRLKINTKP